MNELNEGFFKKEMQKKYIKFLNKLCNKQMKIFFNFHKQFKDKNQKIQKKN